MVGDGSVDVCTVFIWVLETSVKLTVVGCCVVFGDIVVFWAATVIVVSCCVVVVAVVDDDSVTIGAVLCESKIVIAILKLVTTYTFLP